MLACPKNHSSSSTGKDAQTAKIQYVSPKPGYMHGGCPISLEDREFSVEASKRIMGSWPHRPPLLSDSMPGNEKLLRTGVYVRILIPWRLPFLRSQTFFFIHQRNLSFKSLEGSRTAISRPTKLGTGLDVGQDSLLLNLLKSFLRERPKAFSLFWLGTWKSWHFPQGRGALVTHHGVLKILKIGFVYLAPEQMARGFCR